MISPSHNTAESSSTRRNFYVTGCDSGFGRGLVKLLHDDGHRVFAGCLREASLHELRKSFIGSGKAHGEVVPLLLDVTKVDTIKAAAIKIAQTVPALDGLVNNAGILRITIPELSDPSAFQEVIQTNVIGTHMVTESVMRLLRAGRGRIVNVTSVTGFIAPPGTSKHALEGYSDCLRQMLLPLGVTVHIVEPGMFMNTGLFTNMSLLDANDLTEEVRSAYGDDYINYLEKAISSLLQNPRVGSSDILDVSRAIMDALVGPSPRYRYRVGLDCKLSFLLSKMPESISDQALKSLISWGSHSQPVLPRCSSEQCQRDALRRYRGFAPYLFHFMTLILVSLSLVILFII